jgi:hypothetical protein
VGAGLVGERRATVREASLQWALRLGAIAGALGLVAQIVGGRLVPTGYTSIDKVAIGLLLDGMLLLFTLGVALGLAYFAGLRAEQARPRKGEQIDLTLTWGGERRDSALAGAVVMALYWALGTLAGFLFAPRQPGAAGVTAFLNQHVVSALVDVLLGFGMGALGGRAPAARALLDEIAGKPEPFTSATPGAPLQRDEPPPAPSTDETPIS